MFRLVQQSVHGLATQNNKTFLPKSLETRWPQQIAATQ